MSLKQSDINALMREYDRKRQKRARLLDDRQKEVYREVPKLRSLHSDIVTMNAERARLRIFGKPEEEAVLQKKIQALREEQDALFSEHFPEDFLNPPYECPDCKDTGFVDNRKCRCFQKAAVDLLYRNSNLKDVLARENFDMLSMEYYNTEPGADGKSERSVRTSEIQALKAYVQDFDQKPESLLFYGDAGTGKTFLSNCTAKALMDTGHSVVYFSAQGLFDLFIKCSIHADDTDNSLIDQYILESDLLIIDDLGTEKATPYTVSKFFYCINERLLREKATLISTNIAPGNLQDVYTERIASRILNTYRLFPFYGEDIRKKKRYS